MDRDRAMVVACLLALLAASLVSEAQGQACNSALGLGDGTIGTEQLSASSTDVNLQLDFVRYDCCTEESTGAWCPAEAEAGQWLEVRFYRPYKLTALKLQTPVINDGEASPTLDSFTLHLERADSPPGEITPYRDDNGDVEEFTASYTDGVYELDLGEELTVRRVRIQVESFTTRPCFRLELIGCEADGGLVPQGIESPKLSLSYQSVETMALECMLQNDPAFGIQYQVTWFMDDVSVSSASLSDTEVSSAYPVTVKSFNAQQTYRCSIAACYQPDCDTTVGDNKTSNTYRPEILVLNADPIQLDEGGSSVVINFTSTAPPSVLCVAGGKAPDCAAGVVAYVQEDQPSLKCDKTRLPQLLFADGSQSKDCSVQLTDQNWAEVNQMEVAANRDGWLDGLTSSTVTVTVSVGDSDFYSVADKSLTVEVSDQDIEGVCSSLNGIHLTTFDGVTYDNPNSGEYVLYRHSTLPYEIRTFYNKCGGGSLRCNCGAAVRADDDVVLFTGCRTGEALRVQFFANNNIQSGLAIRRYDGGARYEVTLPTGSRLVVRETSDGYINLFFYPSALDMQKTLGLCGIFDGSTANDFHLNADTILSQNQQAEFLQGWKVDSASSMYNGLCPVDATSQENLITHEYSRCLSRDSPGAVTVPDTLPCRLLPGYDTDADVTSIFDDLSVSPANCLSTVEDINVFEYDDSTQQDDGTWPEGLSETSARQACEDTVTSSYVADVCSKVVTLVDLEDSGALASCVQNVRLGGDTSRAIDLVSVLEEKCRYQLEWNQVRWLPDGPPVDLLDQLCPANCSSRGFCQQGSCSCEEGWTGVDCTVDATEAPTLTTISNNPCNSAEDCLSVAVYGLTFVETDQLSCFVKPVTVGASGYTASGDDSWTEVEATFVSKSHVQCQLQEEGSYLVSVANDGQAGARSEPLLYVTFNPSCFSCDVAKGTCVQKTDTCVINGECFLNGTFNPDDHTQVCNADQDASAWSATTSETTSETSPTTSTVPQSTTCLGEDNSYPTLPEDPEIQTATLTTGVRFDCKFLQAESGSLYYVTWTSDNSVLRDVSLDAGTLLDSFYSADLTPEQRKTIISEGITCSVRAANPARCGNGVSPSYTASLGPTRLTVGQPSDLVLTASIESKIIVQFTNQQSPEFYCQLMYGQTCSVVVEVQTQQVVPWKCLKGGAIPAVSVKSVTTTAGLENVCGTQMSSSSQELVVRSTVDNILRSAVNVSVDVNQVDIVNGQRQNGKVLDIFDFAVESSVNQVSICQVYGDPHIQTFDGLRYDVMRPGRFLVYKNKQWDVEVEGYFSITGSGTSACGFGIRSGDDVIKVGRCSGAFATKLYLETDFTPHTNIYQEADGSSVKVFLPTGTIITVSDAKFANFDIVHLEIRPSALDEHETEGLCGVYDGNPDNDLTSRYGDVFSVIPNQDPNDFSETWRVDQEDSLYGGFFGTSTTDFSPVYCSCERNSVSVCTNIGYVAECGTSVTGEDITDTLISDTRFAQQVINAKGRRKRQAADTREAFAFDPTFSTSDSATWPTPGGITEAQARTSCEEQVRNSPAYSQCSKFSEDDFNAKINNCVRDVQLVDDLNWANTTVQVLKQICGTNLTVNSNTWDDPSPAVASVTPRLATDVVIILCPNQCNGQGICVNGVCQCDSNYGTYDCSFDTTVAPTVLFQGSNTLCQTNLANCTRATVRGDNFVEGLGGPTCHIVPISVNENGFLYQGGITQVPAIYRSQYEVLCDLPEAGSYAIRISNDQQTRSFHEALFVAYDSQCFLCLVSSTSTNANCTVKESTCVIDGQCYSHGETHPSNPCLECSAASYDSWSRKSVEQCQTSAGPTTTEPESTITTTRSTTTTTEGREDEKSKRFNTETIIIAASVSSVLVVLIVIGVVVYIVCRRQQKALRRSMTRESDEASSYERVYNGSFGVRTQKSLAFRNPQSSRVYGYYEPTL